MAFRPTVEVTVFLTFFGFFLCGSINTNLMIYRTCTVTLGKDKHNCSLLGNSADPKIKALEKLVQPKADIISMVKSLVDGLSSAILCLFVGPWSDRFGRKPVIVINLIGIVLMNVVMVLFSIFETVSPWYMIVCSVPIILTGGGASLLTVMFAYLTDVTSGQNRGFRMGVFETVMAVAVLLGSASSSYVYSAINYITVYAIAGFSSLLALVHALCFIPESLPNREHTGRFKAFFNVRNPAGMFRTSFQSRAHFNRAIILLLVLTLALYFIAIIGCSSVNFLFLRAKFQWTLQKYTWFNSGTSVLWITSTMVVVYVFHHKLHVAESKLILSGFVSLAIGAVVEGLARVDWLIYAAAIISYPSGGISPMTRSLLSKLVEPEEAGKIFAFFNLVQNLLSLVGAPTYTTLYNATLGSNPSIFLFLSFTIFTLNSNLLVVLIVLQKRSSGVFYNSLIEEDNARDVSVESNS
ncbi:probable peptidoglycan muropeptide transporter SLC46 isoform X2 [Euwallacea fornicatus]|uniref:probable peptidoglycan muropeptide transporter SLC46 isoform X2 n=1 Tax=Euwallacea fornicatus TaxID=995702 RepID=UPI00338DDC92